MNLVKTPYYEFYKLEKEMNLFAMQYQGENYWQLIRFGLLKKITINNISVANKIQNRSIKEEIRGVYKDSKRTIERYKRVSKVDLIRIRPEVTLSNEGKLADHQYDYIELDETIKIMDVYALGKYTDVSKFAEYTLSPAEYRLTLWKIKRKLFGVRRLDKSQKKKIEIFLNTINDIYDTSFDINSLEHNIQYSVASHKIYRDFYKKIFEKTCPEIIMVYPHYDEHMFSAIDAARSMGIKSIEIQHGRINAHEGYWYEDQRKEGKVLPDYFFSYGKWWIEQTKLPRFCKSISVGNIYLQTQIKEYKQAKNKNVIAVFSNPQNGKALSKLIYESNDVFLKNGITVLYKLHPNENKLWKKEYPYLSKMKNVQVIDDGTSVYKILSKCEFALGVNSTVFFEATAYEGIKLIIYKNGDYLAMQPLLDIGLAKGVSDKDELKKVVNEWHSDTKLLCTGIDLWERNAKNNLFYQINEILNKNK